MLLVYNKLNRYITHKKARELLILLLNTNLFSTKITFASPSNNENPSAYKDNRKPKGIEATKMHRE